RGVSGANLLVQPGRVTLTKCRLSASAQMLVRFDQGGIQPVDARTERLLADRLHLAAADCDALVVSDYGYGVLTPLVIRSLAELHAQRPRVLVVDSRRLTSYRSVEPTAVKPNYQEAIQLLGCSFDATQSSRTEALCPHGDRLLELTNARLAAVTLDKEGALFFERGRAP